MDFSCLGVWIKKRKGMALFAIQFVRVSALWAATFSAFIDVVTQIIYTVLIQGGDFTLDGLKA